LTVVPGNCEQVWDCRHIFVRLTKTAVLRVHTLMERVIAATRHAAYLNQLALGPKNV